MFNFFGPIKRFSVVNAVKSKTNEELEKMGDWEIRNMAKDVIKSHVADQVRDLLKETPTLLDERIKETVMEMSLERFTEESVRNHVIPAVQRQVADQYIADNMVEILGKIDCQAIANSITLSAAKKFLGNDDGEII